MKFISTSIKKCRPTNYASQRGLTLVELMVAMVISLFMLIAIALVYSSSKTGFVYANNTVRMSEDASFAIDSISRDIRMAAYGGCAGVSRFAGPDGILNNADDILMPKLDQVSGITLTGAGKPNPFTSTIFNANEAIIGYPGTGPAAATAQAAVADTTQFTLSSTSPILFTAGGSTKAYQIGAAVALGQPTITLAGSPYAGPTIATDTFMLIADCKGAELFRVANMNGTSGVITANSNLLNNYGSDAIVTALQTSAYFLATRNGAANPSLYRRYFNGSVATSEELVPNLEAIAFHYGVNTQNIAAGQPNAGQPTYMADEYKTDSAAVTDWSRVVSIRIGLIMVSEDSRLAPVTDTAVKWIDGNYTPPSTTDNRLRRAYSTTVSIRNRMGL